MFTLFNLGITALVVVAGVVAYKLWKSGQAVTGASVVSGVESDVTTAVNTVKTDVTTAVDTVKSDVQGS